MAGNSRKPRIHKGWPAARPLAPAVTWVLPHMAIFAEVPVSQAALRPSPLDPLLIGPCLPQFLAVQCGQTMIATRRAPRLPGTIFHTRHETLV